MGIKNKTQFKIYQIGLKYPKLTLLITGLLVIVSVILSSQLKLDTDPISLLPKHTQSVVDLNKLKYYFGSNNFIMISLDSTDPEMAGNFADKLIERIENYPEIVYVDFRRPIEFFKQRQWLYLKENDLGEMERRVDRTLELEKKGVSLAFNNYMDFADANDKPDLSFEDILEKYKKKPWVPKKVAISAQDGKFQVIRIKVNNETGNYDKAKKFLAKLEAVTADLQNKQEAFASIKVGYSGPMMNRIDQADSIKSEIAFVAIVVALALILILFAYFRNIESIFIIGLPLLTGILMTGGLMALFLGHLNLITSFAAGIIAGLGSDYGIYLLNRYYHERAAGKSFEEACHLSFANTGSATFGSMLTTVGAFLALLLSQFGFFFEFGVAGAIGIVLNYLCMMLLLPSLLSVWHNRPRFKIQKLTKPFRTSFDISNAVVRNQFRKIFVRAPYPIIFSALLVFGICLFALPKQSQIYYAEGLMENKELPSKKLLQRVGDAVRESLNPTVLIASDEEAERKAVDALTNLLDGSQAREQVYNNVVGLSTLVTRDVEKKKIILARIAEKIGQVRWLPATQKQEYLDNLNQSISAAPVTSDTLPDNVKRFFLSPVDKNVRGVFVYPAFGRNTNTELHRYHAGILNLVKENNLDVTPVDTNFAGDDIIKLIRKEAPKGLLLIFIFLTAVYFFSSRCWSRTFIVIASLLASNVILVGILWLTGIELNVLNIVAFPIILGTGIDSFIHFAQHYDEHKNMILSVREKMPAIAVSNLTSLVGFAGLLLTSYSGLRSLGWVVVLGLAIVTFICIFIFPRCLILGEKKSF